jgi:hypothetical protein
MSNDNKIIYDVITYEKENYFLEPQFKLIWNNNREIVGVYKNKNNLFFWNTIDNIINDINKSYYKNKKINIHKFI